MPPSSVEAIEVKHVDWQSRIAAVGTLTASEGINVANEVEGVIETIHVESGQRVNEGDLLVTLNDDVERADLAALQAQEALARANFDRIKRMFEKKTVSEGEFDSARASLQVAEANLMQIKARIARKNIRAPFSGTLGIRNVSKGQYVAPGSKLFSLQDTEVLYADFSVPENHFPEITAGLEVQFQVSAFPGRTFAGSVQAIDAKIEEATRNINVRAQLPNEQTLLLPGMYADIYLLLAQPTARLAVPSTAVVFSSFGDAVFVVTQSDSDGQIAQRVQVTIGEQRGDLVEILEGLSGDELVVQAGTGKLRNNTPVAVSRQRRLKD